MGFFLEAWKVLAVQNKVLFSLLMQTTSLFNSQDFQGYQEAYMYIKTDSWMMTVMINFVFE